VQLTLVLLLSEASREHATVKNTKKMGAAVVHEQHRSSVVLGLGRSLQWPAVELGDGSSCSASGGGAASSVWRRPRWRSSATGATRGSIAGGLRKLRGSNRSSARTCNLCCVARKSRKLAPSKLVRGRRPVVGCAAPCAMCHIRRPGRRRPVAGAGSQSAGDEAGQSLHVVAAGLRYVTERGGDN
jgi:hypothetical protein